MKETTRETRRRYVSNIKGDLRQNEWSEME
jgi:hypothetical protein